MLTKRPCRIRRRWFVPDRRVGRRQRACSATACQIARRAQTQASWRRRNPDYFIGHRVQRRRLKADEAQAAVFRPERAGARARRTGRRFFEREYASYPARFRVEAIAPIQNKVGEFLVDPVLRRIVGQPRKPVPPCAG